jgi:hypothetical protein
MMNSKDGGRVAPMGPAVGCGDGSVGSKETDSTRMVVWRSFVYFSCCLQVNAQGSMPLQSRNWLSTEIPGRPRLSHRAQRHHLRHDALSSGARFNRHHMFEHFGAGWKN